MKHYQRYTLDGTDSMGIFCGIGDRRHKLTAPWAVHDADKQDWIFVGGYFSARIALLWARLFS